MRVLTTQTRKRVEDILLRLATGEEVSLKERINLKKYSLHIPFIATKLTKALENRRALGNSY